ncbi:MAG: DUF3987 domain-containing protein [Sulfuriferula sp.]|nr:DUF3987 domain-containing protein [Sulfuriferula sp.]
MNNRPFDALMSLDAGVNRSDWVRAGMAAKAAGLAFEDFNSWSATAPNYKNESDCRTAWNSFKDGGGITENTLFMLAKDAGWQENNAQPYRHINRPKTIAPQPVKQPVSPDVLESWSKCEPATGNHPYIVKKQGLPDGLRVRKSDNALIVPCYDQGELVTLQVITDSEKKNLKGASFNNGYFTVGTITPDGKIYLCEGIGQSWAVNQVSNCAAVVCFGVGRFARVANALRGQYPNAELIAVSDAGAEDSAGKANCSTVKMPDGSHKNYDANDYLIEHGAEALRALLETATHSDYSDLIDAGDMLVSTTPEPLPELPSVLPFDYAYLPDGLRPFVKDISERMQCPPDFAAVGAFVMMATIIGRKVCIKPMRRDDWTVTPNLWGAVVGNSGVMKSPTLSAALSPIKKLQTREHELFNSALSSHAENAEVAKLRKSVRTSEAKAALKKDSTVNVFGLLDDGDDIDKPVLKRFLTNNASYEALGELLIENPNGLLVESDEIIGLLRQLDASGQEVARSFYLTAADGDKSYTFDRIIRGKGLHIPALCLSVIGGIQPGVLAEYVRQATGGGAGADGLLQRFGLMVYPDISPEWCEVDRYPDSAAKEAVNQLAEKLDTMSPEDIGARIGDYGGVPFLNFDDAAQKLFSEWRVTLEHRLRSGDEHPAIVSHLSKYRKLIPSLALINHLCDTGHGAVGEASLMRAIAFSEYLESHARRIYSYATRPDIDAAKTLLKRLAGGKVDMPFKARDIYIKGWTGLETSHKAQAAIDLLLEYSHLIEREINTGGRPTRVYFQNKGGCDELPIQIKAVGKQ